MVICTIAVLDSQHHTVRIRVAGDGTTKVDAMIDALEADELRDGLFQAFDWDEEEQKLLDAVLYHYNPEDKKTFEQFKDMLYQRYLLFYCFYNDVYLY